MSLKFYSIQDADKQLEAIQKRDDIIKMVYEIYKKKYPKYSNDDLVIMIAEKSGLGRSTIWEIIARTGGESVYDKRGLRFL
jgi:2-phosphoglycerate kinase